MFRLTSEHYFTAISLCSFIWSGIRSAGLGLGELLVKMYKQLGELLPPIEEKIQWGASVREGGGGRSRPLQATS